MSWESECPSWSIAAWGAVFVVESLTAGICVPWLSASDNDRSIRIDLYGFDLWTRLAFTAVLLVLLGKLFFYWVLLGK